MSYVISAILAFTIMLTQAPSVLSGEKIKGIASNYAGTAGFFGTPGVALPGKFGGRYTGHVNGHVTVCADRCATLPIIDWCFCKVYPSRHPIRIVDLNYEAWRLVSDAPLEEGLIPVTIEVVAVESPKPKETSKLPNTAITP